MFLVYKLPVYFNKPSVRHESNLCIVYGENEGNEGDPDFSIYDLNLNSLTSILSGI
jgi:hypothetical protein